MPDISLSRSRIQIGNQGTVVLFWFDRPENLSPDDPNRSTAQEFEKEGRHRNVFMVDSNGLPIWRVQDYEQHYPDRFVGIKGVDEPYVYVDDDHRYIDESEDYIIGGTFRGFTFKISLADGTLSDRTWTKE